MTKCDENHEKQLGILQYEIYWGHIFQFTCTFLFLWKMNESLHGKSNKMTCAPSEDSDKPGHLLSLIRVITVRMTKPCPLSAQRRPWSDGMDAQADLSPLGAQIILLILSCFGSNGLNETLLRGKYSFLTCTYMVPVGNSVIMELVRALHSHHVTAYFDQVCIHKNE